MDLFSYLPANNLAILGLGLIVAIGAFVLFLRSKSNRRAASNAFSGDSDRSALARKAEHTTREPNVPHVSEEQRRHPSR